MRSTIGTANERVSSCAGPGGVVSTHEVNVFDVAVEGDDSDPAGVRARAVRLGDMIGASKLGATVYELDPGESVCPYHYEFGVEEWLIVLSGTPVLRDPDGEHDLVAGDVVCFPEGPEGAHKVGNRSDAVARVMIVSTKGEPVSVVYPDSGKIGVWPPGKLFRLDDAVDYWNGEI